MKKTISTASVVGAIAISGRAYGHPSFQEHAHPHTDAAGYFTIETLIIFALGLSIGATLAWWKRRKDSQK